MGHNYMGHTLTSDGVSTAALRSPRSVVDTKLMSTLPPNLVFMAYIFMACIGMAYVVVAYIIITYVHMARS